MYCTVYRPKPVVGRDHQDIPEGDCDLNYLFAHDVMRRGRCWVVMLQSYYQQTPSRGPHRINP